MLELFDVEIEYVNSDKPNVYIAGPMSGVPDLNHPLFNEVAEAFREGGWEVFNPAELDEEVYGDTEATIEAMEEDHEAFLRAALGSDLAWICAEADAIAMLPGWEKSYGARAEHATAVALDLQIIYIDE
jgi:hypothetical protein